MLYTSFYSLSTFLSTTTTPNNSNLTSIFFFFNNNGVFRKTKKFQNFLGYVSQILDDSRAYANYSKKSKLIDVDDVKLAIHMHVEKSFSTPPPRDVRLLNCIDRF